MRATPLIATLALACAVHAPATVHAADPEIKRETGTPQAVNALHTLRQIPEACARLEGIFTGVAAEPYRIAVVRTSPNCQPRARFVDFAKARPSEAGGWKLNDLIRVPSAACPSQQAVVRVWRKPVGQKITLDADGKSRLYLADAKAKAEANQLAAIPMFAAQMAVDGKACGG